MDVSINDIGSLAIIPYPLFLHPMKDVHKNCNHIHNHLYYNGSSTHSQNIFLVLSLFTHLLDFFHGSEATQS